MSNRANVSEQSSAWATGKDKSESDVKQRIALLESQMNVANQQSASTAALLGGITGAQTQPVFVDGSLATTFYTGPGASQGGALAFGGVFTFPAGYTSVSILFSTSALFTNASATTNIINSGLVVSTVPNWRTAPGGTQFYSQNLVSSSFSFASGSGNINIPGNGVVTVTLAALGQDTFYIGNELTTVSATSGATIDCYANGAGILLFNK